MMAPRNAYPACRRYCRAVPRAPREIHISDSAAYFTGVAKNGRIGRDRLDLLNQGDAIPLGASFQATRQSDVNRLLLYFDKGYH